MDSSRWILDCQYSTRKRRRRHSESILNLLTEIQKFSFTISFDLNKSERSTTCHFHQDTLYIIISNINRNNLRSHFAVILNRSDVVYGELLADKLHKTRLSFYSKSRGWLPLTSSSKKLKNYTKFKFKQIIKYNYKLNKNITKAWSGHDAPPHTLTHFGTNFAIVFLRIWHTARHSDLHVCVGCPKSRTY